jgi:cell division protein FtsB
MVPLMGAAAIVYFGYHGVQGDRGLIAWWNLRYELEKVEANLAEVSAEKRAMEHRVSLLRPESLDRDMLEERARVMLGFVHPDDRIVPLPATKTR